MFFLSGKVHGKNNRKVLPKYVVEEYQEKILGLTDEQQEVELSDQTLQRQKQDIQIRFEQLVLARQLGKLYIQKTKNIQGAPPIYYVSPIIYKLSQSFMGLSEIYAETHFDKTTDWIKYSNNTDYVDPNHYDVTSFSHFTFQETEGLLLINDLQGKFNILSDPSIQTAEQISENSEKDQENDKLRGIVVFQEKQHQQCNEICEKLALKVLIIIKKLRKVNLNTKIINQFIICENCNEFRDRTQDQYKKINLMQMLQRDLSDSISKLSHQRNTNRQLDASQSILNVVFVMQIVQGPKDTNMPKNIQIQCKSMLKVLFQV